MSDLELSVENTVNQRAMSCNVSGTYLLIKRAFDILSSFLGILLLSPVFIITILAIHIDSQSPAIFSQERNGYKGRIFKMYKFRSMVSNAEQLLKELGDQNEVIGHMFKMKNDPRITRVGRIIRKTSIDELPQLFNVLKGDMSIVGPRPPIVREVVNYDAWHTLRLSVKPGLTGLWQVSGRSELGFDEMVRLDLKYIRERGLWYDLKLILRTIPVLLGDSKAY